MSKTNQNEPKPPVEPNKELSKNELKTWFNFPAFEFSCQAVDEKEAQKLLQNFLSKKQ